ncbi:MAG: branched-chain amino acid ABC transporter permease [Verrucomicrobia bacterium]|nr:branched-chain amino acid ABC transporter permease [Verrucomicrobiota bacterium]
MSDLPQLILSGVALGMIYALLAFGYNITFLTSRTLNFAQGEFLMLGALVAFSISVVHKHNYLLGIGGALLIGIVLAVILERTAIRPALRTKSDVSWILATTALGIIARNVAERVWGTDDYRFPSPLGNAPLSLAGGAVRVLPQELLIIGAAAVIMISFELFRRGTILGKAVTAVATDKDAAALQGINVALIITLSFVISSVIAAVAGVLVGPLTLVGAGMGILLGVKAFAAAIIGGLESGLGVVAGGLILGLCEQFTARFISTGYKDTPGFVLLILVLLLKPAGLFGKRSIKKV